MGSDAEVNYEHMAIDPLNLANASLSISTLRAHFYGIIAEVKFY